MSTEPESELDKPIPLSQAYAKRRASQSSGSLEKGLSEERLVEILETVVVKGIQEKIVRLENSINRMIDHIEAVQRGEAEDSALRVTTDLEAADLALAAIKLSAEDYYIYTSKMLAEKLQVRLYDVQQMVRKLELLGDERYHIAIKTGVTCVVPKYSESAFLRMREALKSGEYNLPEQQQSS